MIYNYPMKLIVGLGNPGEKYIHTRHNAGFMFVDYLYEKREVVKAWKFDKYVNAETSLVTNDKLEYLIVKPQTFMNRSGEAVTKLAIKYSVPPADVYIAHDDLDFPLGEFKISLGKGPKLHNGIRSIEEVWKTKEFWRIRLGVDNREAPISGETYVLSNFTENEMLTFTKTCEHIVNSYFS